MGKYKFAFDILKRHKVDFDIVGMSIYSQNEAGTSFHNPVTGADETPATPADVMKAMFANMDYIGEQYSCPCMITEVGFKCDEQHLAESAKYMAQLMALAKNHPQCLGIFYWEPESSIEWNHYPLGAFANGRPTAIMDAWAE